MASLAPAPAANADAGFHALGAAANGKLRVGVFARRAQQPRWIVEALAKAAASDFAELAVVCVGKGEAANGHSLLWSAYCRADRWIFGNGTNWSEARDLELLVPSMRRCELDVADRSWRSRMAELDLDVAFALDDVEDAALEGLARRGTWRFCFGEDHGVREPLAGVAEVIDAAPVTASGIRIHLGAAAPDRLACPSWSRTLAFSVARNRDNVLAKTSEFVARALRDLHSSGPSWLEKETYAARALPAAAVPLLGGTARGLSRLATRVASRAIEKLSSVGQWSLAFRFSRFESWHPSLEGFHRLEPPPDRFWADPFPIQRCGKSYIFFEELPFGAGKAHISVVEVDRRGRASQPVRVLERDYHLSYPFLVEDAGELYMVPETAHNDTVEIYRCVEFPCRWRRERVLIDGIFAADATLHREGDRWWMFANASANGAEIHDELYLFSAGKLLGDWTPHRRNPVKSDVRSARPAGSLFRRGSALYRPAQICAPLYGSGIRLNRVTRLDADAFAEEEERRIVPPQGGAVLGIHTINRVRDLSVIDTFARRRRF